MFGFYVYQFGQNFVARYVIREQVQVGVQLHEEGLFFSCVPELELIQEQQCVHKFVLHKATDGSTFCKKIIL